ncbi:MAG: preprotein translocase subunit YajC [Clostridia bacterium]|nr:preprotein translocase subunit YajC [Clostridia bacterium]
MLNFAMFLDAAATSEMSTAEMNAATFGPMIILVVMTIIFYVAMIVPQRKKDKELKKQLSELRVGDKVVTIGGLVGFVANLKEDEVTISTSVTNTLVTFQKQSIGTVISRDSMNASENKK